MQKEENKYFGYFLLKIQFFYESEFPGIKKVSQMQKQYLRYLTLNMFFKTTNLDPFMLINPIC